MKNIMLLVSIIYMIISCSGTDNKSKQSNPSQHQSPGKDIVFKNNSKVIHVFVALCDNKYQGIVPVPAAIGNGQDAKNNLYWGCIYGVKTFFKKHADWQLAETKSNPSTNILERCVFKHRKHDAYLVADAYDGKAIKDCTIDFFNASAGSHAGILNIGNTKIGTGGNAQLIAYVGHDGLMDFSLPSFPEKQNNEKRETIILACVSKKYFKEGVTASGATPLLWSTGLMSPEAYTLEAAIKGWLQKESPQQIRGRAAKAYSTYQKCSVKAASNLLVTGW